MKAFDLHRMALDKVPMDFLGEVALRSLYTFILVFLFLKITGRRGVRQMSLFEVLIILTLGSAAGDVAFYDDVPMLPVLVVFANAIGSIGGWIVATNYANISSFTYTNSIKVFMEPFDMISGMIKAAVFGAIIAIVGCHKGLHTRQGAEGVGISTTAAVVLSIILIFISNYFLSIILFVSGGK